jgi:hypothetical protein
MVTKRVTPDNFIVSTKYLLGVRACHHGRKSFSRVFNGDKVHVTPANIRKYLNTKSGYQDDGQEVDWVDISFGHVDWVLRKLYRTTVEDYDHPEYAIETMLDSSPSVYRGNDDRYSKFQVDRAVKWATEVINAIKKLFYKHNPKLKPRKRNARRTAKVVPRRRVNAHRVAVQRRSRDRRAGADRAKRSAPRTRAKKAGKR